MIFDIKDNILAFHTQIADDPNHRYRSWDHCYSHFQKRASFTSDEDIDTASLHLAFYLASWGMCRGASWLLWKDYRFVVDGIKIIDRFPARFGRNSYLGFVKFYQEHALNFKSAQAAIAEQGMIYPVMKLVDMYFWNLGYQLETGIDEDTK